MTGFWRRDRKQPAEEKRCGERSDELGGHEWESVCGADACEGVGEAASESYGWIGE